MKLKPMSAEEIRDVILGSNPTCKAAKDACIHDLKPVNKTLKYAILCNLKAFRYIINADYLFLSNAWRHPKNV